MPRCSFLLQEGGESNSGKEEREGMFCTVPYHLILTLGEGGEWGDGREEKKGTKATLIFTILHKVEVNRPLINSEGKERGGEKGFLLLESQTLLLLFYTVRRVVKEKPRESNL